MAFKVPALPRLYRAKPLQTTYSEETFGLPKTNLNSLEIVKTIGKGSYGLVKLCKKSNGALAIVKELIGEDEDCQKLFIKEAKVMHSLNHKNVVKFDSLINSGSCAVTSFLMEYVNFDFKYFGLDYTASSLKELLGTLDKEEYIGFEHFQIIIARDITNGLKYLHDKGIVHRDLKPENILVSNQHYDESTIASFWETRPVMAKLTDFGESRTPLVQTSSVLHTRTNNLFRGSPVYMAPEIHLHDGVQMFGFEDLKHADVWSLAMVFYLMLNPDQKYPFEQDLKKAQNTGLTSLQNMLRDILQRQELPTHGSKYAEQRAKPWSRLLEVFHACAKYAMRPSVSEVCSLLESDKDNNDTQQNDGR